MVLNIAIVLESRVIELFRMVHVCSGGGGGFGGGLSGGFGKKCLF